MIKTCVIDTIIWFQQIFSNSTWKFRFILIHQSKAADTNIITPKNLAKASLNCHQHEMYTPKRFSKMAFATGSARITPCTCVSTWLPLNTTVSQLQTIQHLNYLEYHQNTHIHTQRENVIQSPNPSLYLSQENCV